MIEQAKQVAQRLREDGYNDYCGDVGADTIDSLVAEVERLANALHSIGDFAHDKSTGPVVEDGYWEIRRMAYDQL